MLILQHLLHHEIQSPIGTIHEVIVYYITRQPPQNRPHFQTYSYMVYERQDILNFP